MQFLVPFTCLTALSIPIVYALFFVVELPCLEYMVAETRIVFYTVGCSVRNPGKRSIIFYFSTSIFYSSFHSIFPIFPCILSCSRQLVSRRSTKQHRQLFQPRRPLFSSPKRTTSVHPQPQRPKSITPVRFTSARFLFCFSTLLPFVLLAHLPCV